MPTQNARSKKAVEPTKKIVNVPVGATPFLSRYALGSRDTFIDYKNRTQLYIEGSITELIARLTDIVKENQSIYSNISIREERRCGCFSYDCSCSPSYGVYGDRLETDLEFQFRIEKDAKDKELREARERKEFERLAKKFAKQK